MYHCVYFYQQHEKNHVFRADFKEPWKIATQIRRFVNKPAGSVKQETLLCISLTSWMTGRNLAYILFSHFKTISPKRNQKCRIILNNTVPRTVLIGRTFGGILYIVDVLLSRKMSESMDAFLSLKNYIQPAVFELHIRIHGSQAQ